jgi:hypothetical protein
VKAAAAKAAAAKAAAAKAAAVKAAAVKAAASLTHIFAGKNGNRTTNQTTNDDRPLRNARRFGL